MTTGRARELRQNATEVETRLWHRLRSRQFDGFKFRRQRPIGPYVVDFVCLERRLVIELDGGQHAERADHDARRDAFLRRTGYCVLRFWNSDVVENFDGVLQTIEIALRRNPHPDPLPQAGEGARRLAAKRRQMARARVNATEQNNPLPLAGEGRVRVEEPGADG